MAEINNMASASTATSTTISKREEREKLKALIGEATEKGDVETVKKLLENTTLNPAGVKIKREGLGKTPLMLACTYGQNAVVEEFLKIFSQVRIQNEHKRDLLPAVLKLVNIQGGADPLSQLSTGRTTLHEVCVGGHVETLKLLLLYTDQVNLKDRDGQMPAHIAAYNGEIKCLRLLADKGADLVSEDAKGRQPAHLAAIRNHKRVLQFLFDQGVDLDCRCYVGKTPLHYAAQHGALDCVMLLVQHDCDITLGDNNGYQAAHHAAKHDKLDCLRFLVKQGTSVEVPQADGKTPAHVAALHGSINVLHWLLDKGADPNSQDYFGNTPGHYACEGGHPECLNCFLQHDGEADSQNIKGDTPMDAARKFGHPLLMQKGVTNEQPCPSCWKKYERVQWEKLHPLAPVERNITIAKSSAYKNPVPPFPRVPTQLQQNLSKHEARRKKKEPKTIGPKRDLGATYYGDHLDPNEVFKFKIENEAFLTQ